MRFNLIGLLATITLIASITGCKEDKSQPAVPVPLKEVRLGYFGNLTHAQAVLGVSSGEFASAVLPAKFTPRVFNAGPSLIEALFAGAIDIGYVGPGPAISAQVKSHGEGIRVISGAAANGVLIVARKDSGIKTLADLKNKRVATPQLGNTQDLSAKHYLKSVLNQADVNNVLPIPNAEQSVMMSRGEIDAAWAPEPWGSRLIVEAGGVPIGSEQELWKGGRFTLTLIVTTPEFLKARPEVVEKVLRVHRSWTKRLNEQPHEQMRGLGEALAAINGKKLPAGVMEMAIKNVTFTDDPLDETLQAMAQWSYDLGFSSRPADLKGLVDLSILKKLQ